jgi:hypothetical protein
MMEADGNTKCNFAPMMASHCIEFGVISVSMSDRPIANTL